MDEARLRSLADRLAAHKVVGLDSSVFIYQIETHPVFHPLAQVVLSGVAAHRYAGVTSMITLIELTVHPWRVSMEIIAREYESLLVHFPNLHLAEINRDIARLAARLRARFGLRTPDAIQVAAAIEHQATAFVTNDLALHRLAGLIDMIILSDLVRD